MSTFQANVIPRFLQPLSDLRRAFLVLSILRSEQFRPRGTIKCKYARKFARANLDENCKGGWCKFAY